MNSNNTGMGMKLVDLLDEIFSPPSAEAGELSDYARQGTTDRQRALRDAMAEPQPSSMLRRPQVAAAESPLNNEADRQAAIARIAAQQEAGKQMGAARMDIEEISVTTPNSEETKYRDRKTGKIYDFNPNERYALPEEGMRSVINRYGSSYTGTVSFGNGQAWEFRNGDAIRRVR